MNFNIFELRILRFFFIFPSFSVIYINYSAYVPLYVKVCNNKANYSINCCINYSFIPFFNFLIFDYKYLFTYYILLMQTQNFNIFGAKIWWYSFNFAIFRVIFINLHTFVFLYIILCKNKAICSINHLFIAFFILFFLTKNTSSHIIFS